MFYQITNLFAQYSIIFVSNLETAQIFKKPESITLLLDFFGLSFIVSKHPRRTSIAARLPFIRKKPPPSPCTRPVPMEHTEDIWSLSLQPFSLRGHPQATKIWKTLSTQLSDAMWYIRDSYYKNGAEPKMISWEVLSSLLLVSCVDVWRSAGRSSQYKLNLTYTTGRFTVTAKMEDKMQDAPLCVVYGSTFPTILLDIGKSVALFESFRVRPLGFLMSIKINRKDQQVSVPFVYRKSRIDWPRNEVRLCDQKPAINVLHRGQCV